jgi:transcriptional accessory protein Tex/SPT6
VKIIEADKKNNKVIASRRLALEEEKKESKLKIFDVVQEGQIIKGTVRSIVDYGAFVDIGGADGLLHISEMSWTRINHPTEVLKVGEQIEVMVLKIDRQKERISLGLRQISPDPWQELVKQVRPGTILKVKVTRLAPRAAFARLPNRVEGIIPLSELSSERVSGPAEVVQVGDEFDAQVMNVSAQERRITLSKRRADERHRREEGRAFASTAAPNVVTLGDMYGDLLRSTSPKAREEEPEEVEEAEESSAELEPRAEESEEPVSLAGAVEEEEAGGAAEAPAEETMMAEAASEEAPPGEAGQEGSAEEVSEADEEQAPPEELGEEKG